MVAILEKSVHNIDFHPMVDFIESSPLRIETTEDGTQILATVDGIHRTVTELSLSRNLKLKDEEGISSLPDTKPFENLTLMGYNISPNQKFTFQKGQFSHQWKYLIHTIMQCLSPKHTGFNEFSSNIATALVCLATNRTYNFSKMIFDGLVKNVNNKIYKFLMYPRFLTICLRISQFAQITHTQKYVVPFHTKKLFTTLRVNSPSFFGRIVPLFDAMLVQQGDYSCTPTEPHHTPSPEAQSPSHTTHTSLTLPPVTTTSIPTVTPSDTPIVRQYTRRTRIAQSSVFPTVADEPAYPLRVVSQGEACPIDSGFIADQDMAAIDKSFTLPHDSAPRVTSPAAVEGKLTAKFQAQEVEINRLKERVKLLEDREGVAATRSGVDAPINRRSIDEGEAATERISDDSEEMATILTSMEAATVLASGAVDVPTGSGSIPTASTPAEEQVPTSSDAVPTASLVFTTATVIDAQVARELEEQLKREDQRRSAQIARDAEIVRIHVEEELQSMIDGLDRNNETIAKYLQEYHQFFSELPIERRIELISNLVKYQDNYAKVHKFQSQQRKPWTKKQKRDYYMAVIRSNLGWKVKDFRGMMFEEVKAKFNSVWKQIEDFILMGSKEEAERFKRKGISFEQESAKKQKTSEEVTEEAKPPDEVPEEKVKEMMQLVPIGEVYVEALQHLDWEDLNQSWRLVKETLSNRPPTSDKEMELWAELSRLYEPDHEDQLWTHTQNFMHAPVKWKLYDSCGVHYVTAKDYEIFMLVEKDYPLRKGLALVMICYKLQVENYSQMANDLILKIYKIANSPRQQVIEFPLAKELPTASEEGCYYQKKSEAIVKIALLSKVKKKLGKVTWGGRACFWYCSGEVGAQEIAWGPSGDFEKCTYLVPGLCLFNIDGLGFDLLARIVPRLGLWINRASL
nr:hypothetical protein [Tanacetum cinerariifolium]